MTALNATAISAARSEPDTALFKIAGSVSNNSTWSQYVYFRENNEPFDISDLDWALTFRSDPRNTSVDHTLTIGDGLTITTDDNLISSILWINVTAGDMSGLLGDYVAELSSQDADDVVTLWAKGAVTFTANVNPF